jgi:hypothetical protein
MIIERGNTHGVRFTYLSECGEAEEQLINIRQVFVKVMNSQEGFKNLSLSWSQIEEWVQYLNILTKEVRRVYVN